MKSLQIILQHRQSLRYCLYRSISASASKRCREEDDKPPGEVDKFAAKGKTILPATDLLRNAKESKKHTRTVTQAKDEAVQSLDTSVDFQEAVRDVANEYPDKAETEEALLGQLNRHDEATAAAKSGQVDGISDILMGMKIQKLDESDKFEGMFGKLVTDENKRSEIPDIKEKSDVQSKTKRKRFGDGSPKNAQEMSTLLSEIKVTSEDELQKSKTTDFRYAFQSSQIKAINFSQRLEVFESSKLPAVEDPPRSKSIWDIEEEKQFKDALYGNLQSGFEEIMRLTEEGKLWKYPIDNEQGMEEEQKVEFHEHIFLEQHLTGFPESKAIQNFMELVTIGLGKNPYLTVQQKIEHIDWFREYFRSKGEMVERFESTSQ